MTDATGTHSDPGETLLDLPLVADPHADSELGAGPSKAELLSDDEIRGARFQLVRRTIERVEAGGTKGLAVAMDAYFHPAPGTRFTDAVLRINLSAPAGAVFADVAPEDMRDPEPVRFKITRNAALKITVSKLEGSARAEREMEYVRYASRIVAIGAGGPRAMWTFAENERTGEPIGPVNRLVVTLAGDGPFDASTLMSCQLVRRGLGGLADRVRELILGPQLKLGVSTTFRIEAPQERKSSGWFDWL
jgi:hypothetical protein